MRKKYICECSKIFDSPQSFNGHKSNCETHLKAIGKWEARQLSREQSASKIGLSVSKFRKSQKDLKNNQWISEKHTCEKCGKIMTEKFGSGRFCSRACANSHKHSETTKNNISIGVKLTAPKASITKNTLLKTKYYNNPKICKVCGNIIPYDIRGRITCSETCYRQLRSNIRATTMENQGIHSGFNKTFLKYGFYKGIKCDSGWELAFLLYHMSIGNNIVRNTDYFIYYFDGVQRRYYPDFIINGIYYEIKGYKDDKFFEKIKQFPIDKQLIVIDSSEISQYLYFAISTFGEDFYTLYDKDRPNWLQHEQSHK